MSGNKKQQQFEERRKYVTAFNSTMVKIWKERITFLTLSLKKLPMLFCFNYQRLNYFV